MITVLLFQHQCTLYKERDAVTKYRVLFSKNVMVLSRLALWLFDEQAFHPYGTYRIGYSCTLKFMWYKILYS